MRIFAAALSFAVPPPPPAPPRPPPPPPAINPPTPIEAGTAPPPPAAVSHLSRTRVSHTPVVAVTAPVAVDFPEGTFILGALGVGRRVLTTWRKTNIQTSGQGYCRKEEMYFAGQGGVHYSGWSIAVHFDEVVVVVVEATAATHHRLAHGSREPLDIDRPHPKPVAPARLQHLHPRRARGALPGLRFVRGTSPDVCFPGFGTVPSHKGR